MSLTQLLKVATTKMSQDLLFFLKLNIFNTYLVLWYQIFFFRYILFQGGTKLLIYSTPANFLSLE